MLDPRMLSEVIKDLTEIFDEHGDLPCFLVRDISSDEPNPDGDEIEREPVYVGIFEDEDGKVIEVSFMDFEMAEAFSNDDDDDEEAPGVEEAAKT